MGRERVRVASDRERRRIRLSVEEGAETYRRSCAILGHVYVIRLIINFEGEASCGRAGQAAGLSSFVVELRLVSRTPHFCPRRWPQPTHR